MNANDVLDEFARELGALVIDQGWLLHRSEGRADRSFVISREKSSLFAFTAKLSQSSPAFWGLGIQKAATMIAAPGEFLLLLTAGDAGYCINPVRLAALMPKFSKDDHEHDYKIGERKVRRELRFRSLEELVDLVRGKLPN